MTTLPQTTTVRAPQPAAPGTPPMLYAHAGAQVGAGAFPMTATDIWRIIRANMWLIIIMVVLSVAAGFLSHVIWMKNWPSYTATGFLKVRREIMTDAVNEKMRDMSDSALITALRTQSQMLQMEWLHSKVILKPGGGPIRETKWFAQFRGNTRKVKEDLQDHFKVNAIPDSELLMVRMTCADPIDAQVIVNEIVGQHLEDQREEARTALSDRTLALRTLRERYDKDIAEVATRIRNLQMSLAKSGMGVEGLYSAREAELRALVEGQLKLAGDAAESSAQFKRFQGQIEAGLTPPEVQRYIDNDPLVAALSRELISFQIRHDAQLQIELLGKEHKDVVSVAKLMDLTDQKLKEQRDKVRVNLQAQLAATFEGIASTKQAELKSVRDQIDRLKAEHEALSREMASLILDKERMKELSTQRQQIDNILNNINASQNPESQARIAWASPAQLPEMPSWPKLWFMLPAAFAVGLALALCIAFLREFMDDTVRSPRDIARVGQMTLLGMIADEDDDPQVANAKLPIFDAPHSLTAEQFRQVRTRLQHAASLETLRSIMVTGPSPMDGKTTVAANLAAGLALNGRKILLVDANFRRPEIHHLFGFSNDKGFSDILNGSSAFDDCLHPTRIPNLSVMTSGPKPLNVTELFESQLLMDYIEKALEEFDHVIFDSGPLLVVSESVAMAPRVDGVVTVVRAHAESRGLLQRMRDALRQIKAEHIGVVLNAVRAQGGGYYARNIKAYYTYNNGQ